jgi:hypothetical protein
MASTLPVTVRFRGQHPRQVATGPRFRPNRGTMAPCGVRYAVDERFRQGLRFRNLPRCACRAPCAYLAAASITGEPAFPGASANPCHCRASANPGRRHVQRSATTRGEVATTPCSAVSTIARTAIRGPGAVDSVSVGVAVRLVPQAERRLIRVVSRCQTPNFPYPYGRVLHGVLTNNIFHQRSDTCLNR